MGVSKWLSNAPGKAEQMTVVLDCRGMGFFKAVKEGAVVRDLAITLTKNYPARLGKLYLVDLPPVLNSVLNGVRAVLHKVTREKIVGGSSSSSELPEWPAPTK